MKNTQKSSRAKADLFELLIAQGLVNYFVVKRNYQKEISGLKTKIKQSQDGIKKIEDQKAKSKKLLPVIIRILKRRVKSLGEITDILWIGRIFVKTKTLADVEIYFSSDARLGLSLKSVGVGTGTQKNVGYKTLKYFLGLNLDKKLANMWRQIKNDLKRLGGNYRIIADLSTSKIKKNKYRLPKIQSLGKKYGFPVQKEATIRSVRLFNTLSLESKLEFLKYLLGYDHKTELLTIISTKNNLITYSNNKYDLIVSGKLKITARMIKDKSYALLINGIPMLRLQSSFTNGVGISAFCQRAFLDKI